MTHLDLFSGIGGFAYAADQVFGKVKHIFCDNDKFCQAVLRKHWPEAKIYGDIRKIDTNPFDTRLERQQQNKTEGQSGQSDRAGQNQISRPFILTGGFPCQPFSAAGLRRGTADERHLWPEMLRVIRLTSPTWVIAENVRGLITWNDGLVFEQVCIDLEASGYEVQPFIIPAVAVNTPHRRDRIWFVAHSNEQRFLDGQSEVKSTERYEAQPKFTERNPIVTDTGIKHGRQRRGKKLEAHAQIGSQSLKEAERFDLPDWGRDWHEVAAEFCSVDDGLPVKLDGFELSKSQHRKEQLKAYGNAIVPQVAMQIMEAMK